MRYFLDKKEVHLLSMVGKYSNRNINIAIDSSKTNTAIVVMSSTFKVLNLIEFDGKADKDIYDVIKAQRDAVKSIFENSNILEVYIEDVITKNEDGNVSGVLNYHYVRLVLTSIFVSFMIVFEDYFGVRPKPINNRTYLSAVLPTELNKRNIYKGSVDYIKDLYPEYIIGGKDDDGADALCLGIFMKMKHGYSKNQCINEVEGIQDFSMYKHKCTLYPPNTSINNNSALEFQYNDSITFDMNVRYMSNSIGLSGVGYCYVDIKRIEVGEIYNYCRGVYDEITSKLLLVVVNE